MKPRILIVDDEAPICELLQEELTGRGYQCATAGNAQQALARLAEDSFDTALLDILLPGMNGIDLLKQLNASYPFTAFIMLTAVNNLEVAVEAMKAGALDYITKPFNFDRIDNALQAALANKNRLKNGISDIQDADINEIEAIALGVEARQEMLDVHSEIVTQQTAGIARKMGFSEGEIQKWVAARSDQQSRKVKPVINSIFKLVQDPTSRNIVPQ